MPLTRRFWFIPPRQTGLSGLAIYDLWQHLAQPAASVQHLAQVAGSLQQAPLHAEIVFVLDPVLYVELQPVVISIPAANTATSVIIDFMFFLWLSRVSLSPIALRFIAGKFICFDRSFRVRRHCLQARLVC